MSQRNRKTATVSIMILTIALLAVFGPGSAAARPITSPILAPGSAIHQVPDFSAKGVGNGYSLDVSPSGGFLSTDSSSISLTAWGYVTADWGDGTTNIIFLVNVTQTNFHIAFLYLTNSSSQIVLRIFQYQGGSYNTIVVQGTQHISNKLVDTNPVTISKPHLEIKAQADNGFAIFGSEIFVNGNYGKLLNGSRAIQVAALRTQVFNGPSEYNELWSLLADDLGNYYFAIIYMQNSDPQHVIIEHQLRLNDYWTPSGRTLKAPWVQGHFASSLMIRIPISSTNIKVDGFSFQTTNGILEVDVPGSWATVEVPNQTSPESGMRMRFTSWDSYGTANPLNVSVNSLTRLTANYNTEYSLTVESKYPGTKGAGWYPAGTNATFSVPSILSSENGTRRVFLDFRGDYNSTSSTGHIAMSSAKRVSASWKTQYAVKLQLSGAPTNSTVTVNLNGKLQAVNGSKLTQEWVDENTQLNVEVRTPQIQTTSTNYNFKEIQVDGRAANSSIKATKALTVTIVFSNQQKAPSSMNAVPVKTQTDVQVSQAGSRDLSSLPQEFSNAANGWSYFSMPIMLARPFLALGVALAAQLIPGGATVFGYFLGSLLLGFVFVFPTSTAISAYRSSRNRRSPNIVWLLPLFTIWIAALALAIGRSFLMVPESLAAASTILLVASNALLLPLAASVLVAMAVAN